MILNNLLSKEIGIHSNVFQIIWNNNRLDDKILLGTHSLMFNLNAKTEQENNIHTLEKNLYDIYVSENYKEFLLTDNNIGRITKIFNKYQIKIYEFLGKFIKDESGNEILIIDKIDFKSPAGFQKDITEVKMQLNEAFDLLKYGLVLDKINEEYLVFSFLGLSTNTEKEGLELYKTFNIILEENIDKELEVPNILRNRDSIVKFIKFIFLSNEIKLKVKLSSFSFKKSKINNTLCIDHIRFKLLD